MIFLLLIFTILCEVFGSTMLKVTDGLKKPLPFHKCGRWLHNCI